MDDVFGYEQCSLLGTKGIATFVTSALLVVTRKLVVTRSY